MQTDVIVVGAGPIGLMLAGELRLAGVRTLVLEKHEQPREVPKAGGLGGQILELLRYRGLLERFRAASPNPDPAPRFPFGGLDVDLTKSADSPLHAMVLPQRLLEQILDERAAELGAEVRRGHPMVGLEQDATTVTAEVRGPDGPYRVTARYLVGCDGSRSRVRELAGIGWPGTTYPEVHRLAQVTVPDSLTRFDNGDLDVPGVGRVRTGFTRTGRGMFALGPDLDVLSIYTAEDEAGEYDDNEPMTLDELRDSIRRVLGGDLPLGEPRRLSRWQFQARLAERYRDGRVLLAGDAAHLLPATGAALNLGMLDAVNLAWKLAADVDGHAPDGLLDTYQSERTLAASRALLQTRAQVALRRGQDPAADALREVVQELLTDEPAARRIGEMIAGSDVRYPVPGSGHHALTGTFAPDLGVDDLLHAARPVLLVLAERPDLLDAARGVPPHVDVRVVPTEDRPADALLIRPDAHIAWAAAVDEPADTAVPSLREALTHWFGAALEPAVPS
ncbi:FAD-dependent monooxygenase [Cryptosporangium aurantiacum]|uniref:2-polyprenyl-6-methoxyphenol hydroxylase n=1 Tax=Cryptosporangium aurantiacum TaxID=134849 RepID=A0A1M7RGK6_9ACTN|nr:FAD-dependent monooxygenase [Cryptosporangium aurantiacum]SHN45178.1 2-polyprenyl-6-methoxyphenol hydroxylase [Cryptosporangium aurantiacum]